MRDIKGYEGIYAITSCGKVWSYRRQKFLKDRADKDGYRRVNLSAFGTTKTFFVHRLVAEAYIPNPENKTQVNHIDEVKSHNYIGNLEWVSRIENMNHGTQKARAAISRGKPVYCVELDRTFDGAKWAAQEIGISANSITQCCRGNYKTAKGYHWRYV